MSESRTAFFQQESFQQVSPESSSSGQASPLTRLAPLLFVVLSLVLHALLFLFLEGSRVPVALDQPLQDRRLEISLIVEALPELVPEIADEEVFPEEVTPQEEISSVAQKPRQDGEQRPSTVPLIAADEVPAKAMQEPLPELAQQLPINPPAEQVTQVSSPQSLPQQEASQPSAKPGPALAKTQSVTLVEGQAVGDEVKPVAVETALGAQMSDSDSIATPINDKSLGGADELPPELAFLEQLVPAPGQNATETWQDYGNMKPLDDTELANIRSFIDGDDLEGQRWRAISQYLVRLEQHIYRAWNGQGKWPLELGGVIRFQLTEGGALQKVYVQLGSGRAD